MMTPSQIALYAARRCTRSSAQRQRISKVQAFIRQGANMEKTWTYRELELREEIAKAIEKVLDTYELQDDSDTMWAAGMNYAAQIARGEI
jgi:hypothetical protein